MTNEELERDLAATRLQLAALHEAATAYRNRTPGHDAMRSLGYEPFTHPETGETLYRRTEVGRPTCDVLDALLTDLSSAARGYEARVRAEGRADLARRALDLAAEIELPGHEGDEESGCHDEDCQRCAIEALLAMLNREAEV